MRWRSSEITNLGMLGQGSLYFGISFIENDVILTLLKGSMHFPDLPTVVFIGPSLLWFSAFMAVLAGRGPHSPE